MVFLFDIFGLCWLTVWLYTLTNKRSVKEFAGWGLVCVTDLFTAPHPPLTVPKQILGCVCVCCYSRVPWQGAQCFTDTSYLYRNQCYSLSILVDLGEVEDEIFKKRRTDDIEFRRRNKEKRRRDKMRRVSAFVYMTCQVNTYNKNTLPDTAFQETAKMIIYSVPFV